VTLVIQLIAHDPGGHDEDGDYEIQNIAIHFSKPQAL
jgi:hypothetical protein